MGNIVAFLTHLSPGDEIIAESSSHFMHYEAAGCSALAGAIVRPIDGPAGRMDLSELAAEVRPGDRLHPGTELIVAENTHNLAGGTCLDLDYMRRLWEIASERGVRVHLDGARLFNAAVALGTPSADLAGGCDSVMIDLSKGLCAPYGSVLCGPSDFIARAVVMRQRVGGNTRQIGHMAAAGIIALESMVDRLAEDHSKARLLGEGIHATHADLVDLDLVQTNMVMLDTVPLGLPAAEVAEKLSAAGVLCHATSRDRVRLVTHRDISAGQIEDALTAISGVLTPLTGA
jgi:threonine aldolase